MYPVPSAKKLLESLKGVTAFVGDASQAANVQKAMQSCVAAVTTLGSPTCFRFFFADKNVLKKIDSI